MIYAELRSRRCVGGVIIATMTESGSRVTTPGHVMGTRTARPHPCVLVGIAVLVIAVLVIAVLVIAVLVIAVLVIAVLVIAVLVIAVLVIAVLVIAHP
jgi:hypothetical protein